MNVKILVCAVGLAALGCGDSKKSEPASAPAPKPVPKAFEWDEAERTAAIEAGTKVVAKHQCTRCHKVDELPGAGRPYDCVSCHVFIRSLTPDKELYHRIAKNNGKDVLDRYIEKIEHFMELPDLTGIAKRVRPEWIASYLANPHDLRPMLDESMIRNKLTDDEIKTLVRYFSATAGTPDPYHPDYQEPKPRPKPTADTIASGRKMFNDRGCAGCHTFGNVNFGIPPSVLQDGKSLTLLAPNLRYVRDRTLPDVLIEWITDPIKIKPGTKMPKMVQNREEAELIAEYLLHGDYGPMRKPVDVAKLMELPPAVDRKVGWEEVKEEVLGFVCVHCHMNDHEKDTGPGNKGGLGYDGIGLAFRTYERTVYGAIDKETGERYSVLVPREGETMAPILDSMMRRRVENRRDRVFPFMDTEEQQFGEGRLGMPMGLPAMTDEQIGILRAWIEQGCPGPKKVTGRADKDDGFLVPDGPIKKNKGCELRAPAEKAPKWATRAQPKKPDPKKKPTK